ncbi:DUF2407 C-terminal domain-containing protein, partial [Immersiella caudata]
PLHLTVRFSTSLPDLHLDILTPHQTTIAALKHLIRARLADDANAPDTTARNNAASAAARGRLRFIHGGKILPDHAALSSVLKPLPPPPPAPSSNPSDPKGKGKHVEGRQLQRVYVNCSIGDELSPAELAVEAAAAAEIPPPPPASPFLRSTPSTPLPSGRATGMQLDTGSGLGIRSTGTTQRAPRGFDRLLTAGFTSAEVNQLRLQFRSIQAQRHTPDTMPSPDTLRTMEDAWIDSNGAGAGGGGGGAATGAGAGGEEGAEAGGDDAFGLNAVIDAMIKGMFIGFVFPLGAIGWLLREEGIWPKRMQVFVSLGFLLSLSVGIVRALGGE